MRLRVGVLALVLVAPASVGLQGCGSGAGGAVETQVKASSSPRIVPVTVVAAGRRAVERTIDVVGTLHGWEQVTLGTKKDGRIRKIYHDMGDRVRPGEPIAAFETEDADLAVRQAERQLMAELAKLGLKAIPTGGFEVSTVPTVVSARVKLEKARQNLNREQLLISRNAGTMQDFQNTENDKKVAEADLDNAVLTAEATLASAEAAQVRLEIARHDRKQLEILVPSPSLLPEGVTDEVVYAVSKRSVAEGQFCRVGDPIVELVIEKPLRLRASVPEHFSDKVKVGQPVRVTSGTFSDMVFDGKVARINPAVDPESRTFQVEALIPNNRNLLRPGGFARASILVDRNDDATVVPIESVIRYAGVTKVFVIDGNKARAVNVETGQENKGWVEVVGALTTGDPVVVTGGTQLAEGTPVKILRPDTPENIRATGVQPAEAVRSPTRRSF